MRTHVIPVQAGTNTAHARLPSWYKSATLARFHAAWGSTVPRFTARAQAAAQLQISILPSHDRLKCSRRPPCKRLAVCARVRPPVSGHRKVHEPEKGRRWMRPPARKPRHKQVTFQQWLQQAQRLESCAPQKLPAMTLQCTQQLACLPRHSIGKADIPATVEAVNNTLSCATATRNKGRILSDLGKALQAHPGLSLKLHRSPDFRHHLSTLFSLAAADPRSFSDPVNVSQIATAQVKAGHYSPDFWAALERFGLRSLPSRQLVNVLHSAAKLNADAGAPGMSSALQERVWHALEAGGHRLMADISELNVANMWWAFATLGLAVPAAAQDVLKAATLRAAGTMNAQEVSMVLWAFATLQLPVDGLFAVLERAVVSTAAHGQHESLSRVMWSWAKLQLPPERIREPMAAAITRNAAVMDDLSLSNVCWAWGSLMLPPADTIPALQQRFAALADGSTVGPQAAANVWWALSRLRVSDAAIAPHLDALLERHLQGPAAPITAHRVLAACAALARPPPPPLLMQLMHALEERHMSDRVCAQSLWALGVLAALPGGGVDDVAAHSAAAGDGAAPLRGAFDAAVHRLASRLLHRFNTGGVLDAFTLRKVHAVRCVLSLERRLGPAGAPLLRAGLAASLRELEGGCSNEGTRVSDARGESGPAAADYTISDKHLAVLDALRSLPELREFCISQEVRVGDNTRQVDILLEGRSARVVVEVDGPSHFVTNCAREKIVRETGSTALRNWQLRDWGLTVVSVPVLNSSPAWMSDSHGAANLVHRLRLAGAPVSHPAT